MIEKKLCVIFEVKGEGMRIFSILLLFCTFSGFCGDAKGDIDLRTGCLLYATLHPDTPRALPILQKFFTEIENGSLTEVYSNEQQAVAAGKPVLGWQELRKKIADSLKGNQFKKNKGKDLALYLMRQWGYSLWHSRNFQPPIKLNEEPSASVEGVPIYPEKWGVLNSDHECGEMFEALLNQHWGDSALLNIIVKIIRAMDNQNSKARP